LLRGGPKTATGRDAGRGREHSLGAEFWLELREDPRVFKGGECGVGNTYEMPLPTIATEYTFEIDVEEGIAWTFSGEFGPQAGEDP
jgi:hypothetical protein